LARREGGKVARTRRQECLRYIPVQGRISIFDDGRSSSIYTSARQWLALPPMTVTRKQLSPAWVLFILTGLNLFNYLDRYVLSAVLTPLQKDLGINDGQAGRLVTAFMIGVIKPTSKVYRFVVAKPIRTGSMQRGSSIFGLFTRLLAG